MNRIFALLSIIVVFLMQIAFAQNESILAAGKFSQLKEELPTPNAYRIASGAPGHEYWQQKADYVINVILDDEKQTLSGTETMMRIDLPKHLNPGSTTTIKLKWWYNINDRMKVGGRSGMEFFKEDSNYLYTIAQFYPRMTLYNDIEGWQNKQFLGAGEFTLTFGDFDVKITVPSDHIVAATGELQNASRVLTAEQQNRFKRAQSSDTPVFIVTEDEAIENESTKAFGTKTWHFKAFNVRDFAFVSSRKFIWDVMGVKFRNRIVLAMSFYPKEGNPLWEKYSTKAVAHTLKNYSKFTFDYPYPQATSVQTGMGGGMEYPIVSFNGGRPESDGTYSKDTKYGLIGVIIHEVGHNYFPMIVNSDERQWTWMDEGLNTFLESLTENAWERDFPHRRDLKYMADYMSSNKDTQVPIMTNSESLTHFGENAYTKVIIALNILRETILGRDLFDYAFKTYANRWMFKNPSPADFFRTMEDASSIDLDWFWRGWFYSIDHVDIALTNIKWFKFDTKNPDVEKLLQKDSRAVEPINITVLRDEAEIPIRAIDADASLEDFYNQYDPLDIGKKDSTDYQEYLDNLELDDIELLNSNYNYYQLTFKNRGGLVMPLIIEFEFENGEKEIESIPAEIWRYNDKEVSKVFMFEDPVKNIVLDPNIETADANYENNSLATPKSFKKFELTKPGKFPRNPMQLQKEAEELKQKEDGKSAEPSEF